MYALAEDMEKEKGRFRVSSRGKVSKTSTIAITQLCAMALTMEQLHRARRSSRATKERGEGAKETACHRKIDQCSELCSLRTNLIPRVSFIQMRPNFALPSRRRVSDAGNDCDGGEGSGGGTANRTGAR